MFHCQNLQLTTCQSLLSPVVQTFSFYQLTIKKCCCCQTVQNKSTKILYHTKETKYTEWSTEKLKFKTRTNWTSLQNKQICAVRHKALVGEGGEYYLDLSVVVFGTSRLQEHALSVCLTDNLLSTNAIAVRSTFTVGRAQ